MHKNSQYGKGEVVGNQTMVPLERATAISYGVSIVTFAISLTIGTQFAVEYLQRSNRGVGQLVNFGRKRLTEVLWLNGAS